MATQREWLTRDEVQNEARKVVEAAFAHQNTMLAEFKVVLDKIADKVTDGAQASILSAAILHGDPAVGLKGAIPDLRERVMGLEILQAVHLEEHRQIYPRLERIEANQGKMKRWLAEILRWSLKSDNGKFTTGKILAMGTALGTALHYAVQHLPSWTSWKMFAAKLGAMMGK